MKRKRTTCCKCSEPDTLWCDCRGKRAFCATHFCEHMIREHGLSRDEVLDTINDAMDDADEHE